MLIQSVDQPCPSRILQALFEAIESRQADVAIPTFEGRRGHPACFAGRLLPELRAVSEETQGLRSVVRGAARVLEVPVDTEVGALEPERSGRVRGGGGGHERPLIWAIRGALLVGVVVARRAGAATDRAPANASAANSLRHRRKPRRRCDPRCRLRSWSRAHACNADAAAHAEAATEVVAVDFAYDPPALSVPAGHDGHLPQRRRRGPRCPGRRPRRHVVVRPARPRRVVPAPVRAARQLRLRVQLPPRDARLDCRYAVVA